MAEATPLTKQEISDLDANKDSDQSGQGAGVAEVHRWDRRAAADAIKRAEVELAQTADPARKEALDRALKDLTSQHERHQGDERAAKENLRYGEEHNAFSERELAEASEDLKRQQETLSELERNLAEVSAHISSAEQRVKEKRKEYGNDLFHNLDRMPFRTKINLLLRRTSIETLAQEKVYEDRLDELRGPLNTKMSDLDAEVELQKQLATETKDVETALQQQIDAQKEKLSVAEKELQKAVSRHTEILGAIQSQKHKLGELEREMREVGKKGEGHAEAVQALEAEIQKAQQTLAEKQAGLQKAEEDEKAYWQALHDELISMVPRDGLSDEEFSAQKREESKRESVRSMLGMQDMDVLAMANEIGRTAEGGRSVDIAIGDMVDVTGSMVERYRKLAEAAGQYDRDFSALEIRTMADIDNEAFDLTRRQQQIEYAKFGVLDDTQLEAALRTLDQKLDQSLEVQKLKQDIAVATAYLDKPIHKTDGFRRLHQQQIREYEGIKKAGERDLKKASKDVESQKNALTKRNELQKAKANLELTNWKKEYLTKLVIRRRAEGAQALDTFLGSLELFTPEERELAYKGGYEQALAEAEAIFGNLKKWEGLLRNPDAVVAEIAKVFVEQDHLDEETVRKYETTQSAVMLKELEMKGKKGAKREELEGELKVLRTEAKAAETELAQRNKKKQEAIEAVRKQHLPIELAATNPEEAGEIQFGSRKAKTDIRRIYDRVMWGGTVHETAETEIGKVANPTDLIGVVEVYGDVGELDAAIKEEVTRQKTEGVRSTEAGAERSFDMELGDILKEGPEAIKRLVERVSVDEIRGISAEMAQRFIDTINMSIVFEQLSAAIVDHALDTQNISKREIAQRWAVFADVLLSRTSTREVFTGIRNALTKIPNLLV